MQKASTLVIGDTNEARLAPYAGVGYRPLSIFGDHVAVTVATLHNNNLPAWQEASDFQLENRCMSFGEVLCDPRGCVLTLLILELHRRESQ